MNASIIARWALGILAALIVAAILGMFAKVSAHETRIAVLDNTNTNMIQILTELKTENKVAHKELQRKLDRMQRRGEHDGIPR